MRVNKKDSFYNIVLRLQVLCGLTSKHYGRVYDLWRIALSARAQCFLSYALHQRAMLAATIRSNILTPSSSMMSFPSFACLP